MNARVSASQAVPIEAEEYPQWVHLDRRHCLRRQRPAGLEFGAVNVSATLRVVFHHHRQEGEDWLPIRCQSPLQELWNRFLPHKPTQLSIFWLTADLQIHLFDVRLYPDSGWTKAEEDCDQMRL
ncbi:hypothetical protein T12_4212 [Trichinella patagoniensis]|uniref:Uncharacterized protein n=1 Tax=Trichinella patagoniensis TaxID=990121 RepID=A0A0V0ZKK2_9BILA|nr:hypothetical protein T12_4212 [Trichinella patagoniensis]